MELLSLKIFELGGILWLLGPFRVWLPVNYLRSHSKLSVSDGSSKDRYELGMYVLTRACSVTYFFVVSFVLRRDWVFNHVIGFGKWDQFRDGPPVTGNFVEDWYLAREWMGIHWWTGLFDWSQPTDQDWSIDTENWVEAPIDRYELRSIGDYSISFAVDGLSLVRIRRTAFIMPRCIRYCWRNVANREAMGYYRMLRSVRLIVAFWTRDLLVFFIMFEIILYPMYRLIVVWGAHEQKKKAAMSFVRYTVFGSRIRLIVILVRMVGFGTTAIDYIRFPGAEHAWWVQLLWFPAFVSFAVKVPTFPFHHWLTLAHVEAPTVGSVVRAALRRKLGSYGFLRFMLPIFKDPTSFQMFMPLAATRCRLSVIFAALMAISQSDRKRIIAYSSIAHMNFSRLGRMSMSDRAVLGGNNFVYRSRFCLSWPVLFSRISVRSLPSTRSLVFQRFSGGSAGLKSIFLPV